MLSSPRCGCRYVSNAAWAEKLWSSAELQQALRHPPAIGAKAGTTPAAAPAAAVTFEDLRELIAEGIPAALQQESAGDPGGSSSPERGGGGDSGAFMIGGEEEEEEASLLDGVVTAIPRVEVRGDPLFRLHGLVSAGFCLCCQFLHRLIPSAHGQLALLWMYSYLCALACQIVRPLVEVL